MPTVSYTADLARLRKMLSPGAYRQLVVNGMRELGELYVPVARSEAPEATGALRKGLRFEVNESGQLVEVRVFGPSYAKYVVGGTRPHVIEPRTPDGTLAFTVRGGDLVFAKRVNHPGTKPNDFIGRAWTTVRATALGQLLSGVVQSFRRSA